MRPGLTGHRLRAKLHKTLPHSLGNPVNSDEFSGCKTLAALSYLGMLQATAASRLAFCHLIVKFLIQIMRFWLELPIKNKYIFEAVKTYWLMGRETASGIGLTFRSI